jgi:hypothetical protein
MSKNNNNILKLNLKRHFKNMINSKNNYVLTFFCYVLSDLCQFLPILLTTRTFLYIIKLIKAKLTKVSDAKL